MIRAQGNKLDFTSLCKITAEVGVSNSEVEILNDNLSSLPVYIENSLDLLIDLDYSFPSVQRSEESHYQVLVFEISGKSVFKSSKENLDANLNNVSQVILENIINAFESFFQEIQITSDFKFNVNFDAPVAEEVIHSSQGRGVKPAVEFKGSRLLDWVKGK